MTAADAKRALTALADGDRWCTGRFKGRTFAACTNVSTMCAEMHEHCQWCGLLRTDHGTGPAA